MTETLKPPRTAARLLFLHAQTGLHPGAGAALGVIDLPVQRERHTGWPIIPASSLKGVLRDAARDATGDPGDKRLLTAFGPEAGDAHEHAGALALTDARLLAFPVRSLRGLFGWATCPAALERLGHDIVSAGGKTPAAGIPKVEEGCAGCAADALILKDQQAVVLEEFDFKVEPAAAASAAAWADCIAGLATGDASTADRLRSHLVVLSDTDFTHFARHATEVVARIGLDYETKTVKNGALFYQEFLPPETLMWGVALAGRSRRNGAAMDPDAVMEFLEGILPPVLQIGGDETTGKGLCRTRLASPGQEA